MLTLLKTNDKAGISVNTAGVPVERLLEKEWLLTNGRGGFASSTVVGCNTRRYHGLLTAALDPPANRILALSGCLETIFIGPSAFNLATVEFQNIIYPDGYLRLKRFTKDTGAHFHFQLGDLRLTKSVYMLRDQDTVAIVYTFDEIHRPVDFTIRPLIALRDFHSLQKSTSPLVFEHVEDGLLVYHDMPDSCRLLLTCPGAAFEDNPQWWYNFVYRADKERGQQYNEDLFNPGFYGWRIDSPTSLVLWANLNTDYKPGEFILPDIEDVVRQLSKHDNEVIAPAKTDESLGTLFRAADQFIAKRITPEAQHSTILAGFPWFADWGRDAFISLPGLLLASRRLDDAKSVLIAFAQASSQGMIPNCFDDYKNSPHFNSVDASLWFINAAFEYLNASGDSVTFEKHLLPAIISIIDAYRKGTRFGIHADKDGLITAGDSNTQLTWMDAKFQDIAFTPRFGKAVEINALWYNALMLLNHYNNDKNLKLEIDKVRDNFNKLFWNNSWGWLNDCVLSDGTPDASLRPNQIFAVSLPFSPLDSSKQKAVVDIVEQKLLTPFGLRTLSPDDPRYQGKYTGPQAERDRAYHQGTVWPYLIGPFVEAYLKVNGVNGVNGFSKDSKKQAKTFIAPLLNHLTADGCLGQICEIFDGSPPQKPKGCFAQAWSIAELIRAYILVKDS